MNNLRIFSVLVGIFLLNELMCQAQQQKADRVHKFEKEAKRQRDVGLACEKMVVLDAGRDFLNWQRDLLEGQLKTPGSGTLQEIRAQSQLAEIDRLEKRNDYEFSKVYNEVELAAANQDVDFARLKFEGLAEREKALTSEVIAQRNRLLSLPQDSPTTRNITRYLAIINKEVQSLAGRVFGAQLAYDKAVQDETNARVEAKLDAAVKAAAATSAETNAAAMAANFAALFTNVTTLVANAPLQLRGHRLATTGGASILSKIWEFNLIPGTSTPPATEIPRQRFVVGIVENTSANKVINVTIAFTLFDATDDSVGTASAAINEIEPGARWQFKATVPDPAAIRAELLQIKHGVPGGLPILPGTNPPTPTPVPNPTPPSAQPLTPPPMPAPSP